MLHIYFKAKFAFLLKKLIQQNLNYPGMYQRRSLLTEMIPKYRTAFYIYNEIENSFREIMLNLATEPIFADFQDAKACKISLSRGDLI